MSNNRVSETKGLIRGGANVALSCALAASLTPTVALADTASSSSSSDTVAVASAARDAATDITAQWNAGGMAITQGGRYVLSGDVHSTGSLVIAAPEGQTVELDFCGHTAEVRGSAEAAVIVDDTQGAVSLCDSSFADQVSAGKREADSEPIAAIRLVSTSSAASVAAVRFSASEVGKASSRSLSLSHLSVQSALVGVADGVDAQAKLDAYGVYSGFAYETDEDALEVSIDGCSISSAVANDAVAKGEEASWAGIDSSVSLSHAGIAACVFASAKGVTLSGPLRASSISDGGAAHLYATVSSAFSLAESFSASSELRVFSDGNAEGVVFAACANGDEASRLASSFVDATGAKRVVASGADLSFAAGPADAVNSSPAETSLQTSSVASETIASSAASEPVMGTPANPKEHEANPLLLNAVEGSPLELPEWVSYLAEASTDLNKLWTNTQGGLTIEESGTYFLSSDLYISSTGYLRFSGEGTHATLQLNGHKIVFETEASTGYAVAAANGASLKIDGGSASSRGSIECIGSKTYDGVRMESSGTLELVNTDVTIRPSVEHGGASSLNMRAVNVNNGTVDIDSCGLTVDQTNVTTGSITLPATHPAGVYIANDKRAASISVKNTAINVTASPATIMGSADDVSDAKFTGAGYCAYGIYVASLRTPTAIDGCTVRVTSANGMAIGLYGANATVQGSGLSVTASSHYVAAAAQATAQGTVALDAPVRLSVDSSSSPRRQALLYATAERTFVVGEGFETDSATVLCRVGGSENTTGMVPVRFGFTPTTAQLSEYTSLFANALGQDSSCTMEATAAGVRFVLDEAHAPASVVHESGASTAYSSVNEALAAAVGGETVRLAADADDVSFAGADAGAAVTLDLTGHTVTSIKNSGSADLVVVSTGSRGRVTGTTVEKAAGSTIEASIVQAGSGALSLANLSVEASSRKNPVHGMLVYRGEYESVGSVTCEDVFIVASSPSMPTSGVSVQGGAGCASITFKGGSITALQSAASSNAYGIENSASDVSISLHECPVSAETVAGTPVAVTTSGAFSATADSPCGQTISAIADGSALSASGVIVSSGGHASLCNVAVVSRISAAEGDSDAYCLRSAGNSAGSEQWSLDGACSFESSSQKSLLLRGSSLALGASFSNVGTDAVYVRSENLTDDVFARLAAPSSASSDQFAAWFSPVAGTAYDGWRSKVIAAADGSSSLAWSHEAVVRNEATGVEYASATKALSEAASGSTLTLVSDAVVHGSQTVAQDDLKIDLAGHSLTVSAPESFAAVAFTGSGTLSVVDSAEEKGSLRMEVGSATESASHAAENANAYVGILVDSGTLDVEGAAVEAVYTGGGANNAAKDVDVVTCYTGRGSVAVSGSATVSVQGSSASGGSCATRAIALYASPDCSGSVDVASSAAISASNTGALIQAGEVRNGTISSDFEEGYQALRRIQPAQNSSLYQEILTKFRAQATLDDGSSSGENGFGARVYYVERMSLDDGTLVWAVSNQVKDGEELQENIVPAVIFVQSYYHIAPKAIGIGAAGASTVDVTVSGAVNASSQEGDAYGVSAAGKGAWVIDGARVSAQGSSDAYEGTLDKQINLVDYLEVENAPSDAKKNWFYPSSADPHELVERKPVAAGVAAAEGTSLIMAGATEISVDAALPESIQASSATFDPTFSLAQGATLSVGSAAGVNVSGSAFAIPAAGASLDPSWFSDAHGKLSPVKQANGSIAWDGPYMVTFYSEDGVAVKYEDLLAGDSVSLPDPDSMFKQGGATTTYEFLGWSTDKNATEPTVAADAGGVVVAGNAEYYPVYRAAAKSVNVTFSNLRDADGSQRATTACTIGYGETFAQDGVASVPVQGDYVKDGVTYRFVGWRDSSGTVWDARSFATDVTFDYATIANSVNGSVSLSAAFVRVGAGEHLVSFRVDASVVAYALADGDVPSYYDACGGVAVAPQKIATQVGYLYSFAGWHKGYLGGTVVGSGSVDYASTASLPGLSEDVTYTACFSAAKRQAFVKFQYWHQDGNGTWGNSLSALISVEYGTDPIAEANKLVTVGQQVTVNGKTYTFLGWSTRKGDLDALYTTSLPACTNTSSTGDRLVYYGIYRQEAQTVSVVFHDGSDVYAQALNRTGSDTVSEAFSSTGKSVPATKDGKSFLGWATSADATSADAAGSSALSSFNVSSDGMLDLYAVYGDAFRPTLTFASEEGSVLGIVSVDAGASLLSNKEIPTAPAKEGYFFKGWARPDGTLLDLAQGATNTVRLTASYEVIKTNAVEGDDESGVTGSVDVSRASLVSSEAVGANQVVFSLNNATSVDSNLTAQAKVNGDKIISDAVYYGAYLVDGAKLTVAPSVGKVVLKLGVGAVGANSRVRVYWLDGDGSVKYSSAYDSADGMVSVVLSGYTALSTAGNIAVAEVGADAGSLSGATGGTLGKTGNASLQNASTSGGALSKSASGTSLANSASGASAASTLANAADATPDATADVSARDGIDLLKDDVDTSIAISDIAGNPVAWAVALLMMGAAGSVAWYALIGRRRKAAQGEAEVDDDAAGWSDDAEASVESGARSAAAGIASNASANSTGGIKF